MGKQAEEDFGVMVLVAEVLLVSVPSVQAADRFFSLELTEDERTPETLFHGLARF